MHESNVQPSNRLGVRHETRDPLAIGLVEHLEAHASLEETRLRARVVVLAPADAAAGLDAVICARQHERNREIIADAKSQPRVQADAAR